MTENLQKKRRWRVAVVILLGSYVASHFALSRISQEMVRRDWGIRDAFFYLPVRPDVVAEREFPLLYVHHALSCIYAPVWKMDELFFGGPSPIRSMPLHDFATARPSVAEVAAGYTNFQQVTENVVFVNPELALLCRGASKEEVDAARVRFGPHANAGILVFMNDLAAAAFKTNATVFPVGAVVVKQKSAHGYSDEERKRVAGANGVGGMIKRPPGFDPGHGDWEYFYFEDAKEIETGRIASCVQCHESARDRDYVFGTWRSSTAPRSE